MVDQTTHYSPDENYIGHHNGDDTTSTNILQSVKEQEAQFERLKRELEVESKSVANQLEKESP